MDLKNPKTKMWLAGAALLAVMVVGVAQGFGTAQVARAVLGLTAVAVGAAYFLRQHKAKAKFELAPRLAVISRSSLSARAGLALVEIDGAPFLVVHGDGYAEIRPAPKRARARISQKVVLP